MLSQKFLLTLNDKYNYLVH